MNYDRVSTENRAYKNGSDWVKPSLGIGGSEPELGEHVAQQILLNKKLKKQHESEQIARLRKAQQINAAFEETQSPIMRLRLLLASMELAVKRKQFEKASEIAELFREFCALEAENESKHLQQKT